MSDLFNTNPSNISDNDWRKFLAENTDTAKLIAPDQRVSRTADFAKQLEKAQLAEQKAIVDGHNARIKETRAREREAKAAETAAVKDTKELTKLGLPDVSEQRQLPLNWFEAQKATGYDTLPFTEQSKIYSDWLDQAQVRIVTADRSKTKTAREELEKRIPAPVKPKADFFDTDIIDKARIGGNAMLEGVYKVGSALMPEGETKQDLYNKSLEADQAQKDLRASLNPETLDAEKATAFRKNQLIAKYGSEDAIPAWEGFKQGVSSMTQGGVLQTVGNVTQSLASSAPSVVGNVMRVGGAALTATGAGAVVGVPLMAAGTGLATLGGAVATAGDVGGEAYDEAFKFAKSQGLGDTAARAKADEAARMGGAAGAGLGALEGFLGAKFGAGAAAKAGLKAGAKRAGIETITEFGAEAAGQASVNAVLQSQGDPRSLMRGVTEAGAQGAIGGIGMSAGTQALASAVGAEAPSGPVALQNTPAAVQAGTTAASAAINTVAQQAQAAVVQAQAAAQAAVQAAQATGDDTQVAAATAALQAATAQAQAVVAEPVAANPLAALQAAAAAQDGLDAAIATGDPVQIEQATQTFNAAVSATQIIAAQAANTPAAAVIDPAIAERENLNGVQIRDMLDKVEAIPQLIKNNKLGLAGAKQALDAAQPLANAVGRGVNMGTEGQQWVKSIKTGAAPIDAITADSTIEPAQREAAQAVIQAYKATGTTLPEYNKSLPVRGNVAGYIQHSTSSPTAPAQIALNKKIATPATIIHEYLHGLTVRGLNVLSWSRNPEHMDVLEGLDAIITFISQHPSVTNTRAGGVYATTNNKELLAEALSGRVLPLTSNITVQDIINKGGLTNGAIRGLEILTNRQPTTLLQLFTKARDYILNAMGLAAAKKGSVSDAILSAADIAMEEQRKQVTRARANGTEGLSMDEEALPGVPTVRGISGPIPAVVAAAKKYAANAGIPYTRQGEYVKVDPARAKRIAQAYEDMPHNPEDPAVKAAYSAMVEQTMAQYQSLVDSGFKFWLYDASTDPYTGSPWDAIFDLRNTKSMGVYSTDAGYGSGPAATGANPMLADTGITWPFGSTTGEQRSVKVNDVFRAVHDVFGHGIEGAGFRAQGEENTWQAHIRLFTGAAVGAVTTETRGQNSWVNYGPKGVENNTASSADTVFAEQKIGLMPSWTWQEGVSIDEENLLPGYTHLGKNAPGNFATSIDQLIVDATPVQDGVYRTADGTVLDTNDSIAQVASTPAVQALLKDNGFEGFRTEAGETFALGSVDAEVLPALDKKLVDTMAQISYSITDPATTDSQRLKYVAKFLNGTLEPALMDAVNRTGVGLTARAAIETKAPWAAAVMSGDDTLLQVLATSKSDIGEGVAEQARAVLRMYAESGQDMPKVTKIRGLIPFGRDTALGTYDPPTHMIEISDLADPGEVVHEYLHGVTQLGIDAAKKSKEGKALRAVMEYMITTMRRTAVRAGERNPYGLKDEHELMGDMFKPALLRIAAQTPIGTPQSKQAQAMIAELMGEQPGTMIQLLDALIRKIVSFLGVKSVPNNMTELLSRVAARAVGETRKAVNATDGIDSKAKKLAAIAAYHGSPHNFSSFSLSHIGSGEGAQAFGWGLYFSDNASVADWYRSRLSDTHRIRLADGSVVGQDSYPTGSIEHTAMGRVLKNVFKGTSPAALAQAIKAEILYARKPMGFAPVYAKREQDIASFLESVLSGQNAVSSSTGKLYAVSIAAEKDSFLLWDKAFKDQALGVKAALKNKGFSDTATGEEIYQSLSLSQGSDERASSALNALGVYGISYPAGTLSGGSDGTNYVVFDDSAIAILKDYAGAAEIPSVFSSIDMEVLPPSTVPLSAATFKNQLTGRTSSAAFIASISAGVNVQPVLQINKVKALAQGDETQVANIKNKLNDAVHDSQGPAKRWLQALPISANARERIINVLYLAPGKRDTILNNAMEKHGGDAMIKALAAIKKGAKGLTHETVTMWVGHWITANHVAEKNAMLVARRAKTHSDAVQAAALKPNDFRLKLKEAEALQAYTDQVKAVSSTNLDAGSENGPPHAMGVAGGMNNAQAAATMQAVEDRFNIDQLRAVADAVYDMNAFRLALDIEQGKTQVATVAKFLNITPAEQQRLQDLQDARATGTVTEAMRDAARAIVRSEYVPMTGHPLSAIDDPSDGLFSAGAAQPNTGKDYVMEGRTRGIADNGIATSMKGLIRSATFAGYADFTSGIGEVYDMLTPEQRSAIGLSKENINGLTRGSDNVLLDGRTNNAVGYSIQDAKVLEAIRAGNVDEQDGLLRKFAMPTTRMFAYLVTQANPLFGPKNLINDMIERSLIASTREYHTEGGSKVTIGAMDVVANTAASLAAVNRLIRGKADYTNDADVALRDFIEAGGISTSREAFARDAKALAQRVRGIGAGANPRVAVRAVGDWIEKYNKQFDMVAPLSSYLALRSAGVSKVDAAGGALDLMNYRKKGAKTSGFVTPLYAFAQPAFTGGANLLKMMGTPKGKKIAVTALAAFLALQALSEAGADEDEGGNLIRQLPNYARNNNINVQMGSNVVSIPVGFGVTKLANTAARAILDFGNKGNSIPKSIYDVLSEGFMTSLTPFEDNDIKDPVKNILYGTTPTVLKGAAGYALNARADGGQIDREKWIDQGKYRHMQGSKTIAPAYRDMAEMLYSATGWDMTPDAMKYLVQSYGIGPFKHVVANTITNPQKEAEGKDTGLPVIGSFIAPVFKPVNEDAWRGQMRKTQEDMDDMRKEAEKLERDKTSEGRQALRELQSRPEYRLMGQFDVMDKGLRSESAAVTRSLNKKQITATEEERRRDAIRDRRKDQEAQFLVKWRKLKGLE